jgi:hypothetical protein
MANVNDRDLVPTDPIVDNVRIATEPEGMYAELRDRAVSDLEVTEFRDPFLDKCFTSRAARG